MKNKKNLNVCCCLTFLLRKKQRTYGSLTETLEMVTSHEHPVVFIFVQLVILYILNP